MRAIRFLFTRVNVPCLILLVLASPLILRSRPIVASGGEAAPREASRLLSRVSQAWESRDLVSSIVVCSSPSRALVSTSAVESPRKRRVSCTAVLSFSRRRNGVPREVARVIFFPGHGAASAVQATLPLPALGERGRRRLTPAALTSLLPSIGTGWIGCDQPCFPSRCVTL